ncbi:MAG TPA: YhjD/YihY/BrkB family envelope integrity protein [Gammaproteobacteria bacterium]|nr:YhjD/YihY/BrkB family envelope integrity protein [Gammaproteobacteria bacterium]
MDFVLGALERRLWPRAGLPEDYTPPWLVVARYAFALLRDFLGGELSLRAMSLVYTTMIAVVPLLAFSFSVLKALGLHHDLEPLLMGFLTPIGPRASELTQRIIGYVDNVNGSVLASVSVVLLIVSALSMAQKVEASFNFVWRVDRPRSFIRRFSEYLSVMLVGPALMSIAIGFTASLASDAVMARLEELGHVGHWLAGLSALAPYVLVIATFVFLYVFVPNTRVRLRPALLAGFIAGAAWAAIGNLFTSFVVNVSRNEAIYSGFAIVLAAMIWLHLSWLILLLGTQLGFYVQNPDYLRLGQRTEVMSNGLRERLALNAMLLIGRDFEQPGHGWRIESLAARIRIARHLLEPVVSSLMRAGLVTRTTEHRLLPARDPRRITVSDILDAVRATDGDPHHAPAEEWSATVQQIGDSVERAIRDAVGAHTLAELVADDVRAEGAVQRVATAPRA